MKRLLLIALVASSGCVWLFQEHLPAGYSASDSKHAPRCSTSVGWFAWDFLLAAGDTTALIVATASGRYDGTIGAIIAGAVIEGVLHTASGISGVHRTAECQAAIAEWESPDRNEEPHERERVPERPPVEPTRQPFACFASPSDEGIGGCARTTAACNEDRDHELATSAELGLCSAATVAICFRYATNVDGSTHEACGPTLTSCNTRRARAISASATDVGDCAEFR